MCMDVQRWSADIYKMGGGSMHMNRECGDRDTVREHCMRKSLKLIQFKLPATLVDWTVMTVLKLILEAA